MVFRRSAFEEGRRGGAFPCLGQDAVLSGAGCRVPEGTMRTIPPPLIRMVKERVFPEVTFRVSTLHPSFFSARSRRMEAWYAVFLSRKFKGMETVRSLPSPFIRAMYHWFPDRRAKAAHSPMADGGRTMVSSHTEGMFRTTSRSGESFGKAASMSAGLETQ